MTSLQLVERVEQLPANWKVGIYGAGGRGSLLLHILRERRPDIAVACFFDDFKSGEVSGVPVLRYAGQRAAVAIDCVLLASLAAADIIPRLHPREEICLANIAQFEGHYANDYYDTANWQDARGPIAEARAMLEDEASRSLFDCIVEARRRQPNDLAARFTRSLWRCRQYLEHLQVSPIKVMVDGGVFDGATALAFLHTLPHLEHVWGFEPVARFLERSPHRVELEASGRFHWVKAALSCKTGSARIVVDEKNPSAARFASGEDAAAVDVEMLTLDGFLGEHPSRIDLIKFDLEGADYDALRGSMETLRRDRPQLAVSIYHSKEDLFRIPLLLRDALDAYVYRIGHYSPDIYETVLYATPRELLAVR